MHEHNRGAEAKHVLLIQFS